MSAVYIDTEAAAHRVERIEQARDSINSVRGPISQVCEDGDLWGESSALWLVTEIDEELGLAADILRLVRDGAVMADVYNSQSQLGALISRLRKSIVDRRGAVVAMVGDTALSELVFEFDRIDTNGDGFLSLVELQAAASAPHLSASARDAAQYLCDNPELQQDMITSSLNFVVRIVPGLELDVIKTAIANNQALRLLADPSLYGRLDTGAGIGAEDWTISLKDIYAAKDSGILSGLEEAAIDQLLKSGEWSNITYRSGTATFDDIASKIILRQAFVTNPVAARDWVYSIAESGHVTWADISGKTSGIDMFKISDEGLRALVATAMTATTSLKEEVMVVASIPESPGGVRNELITYYYAQLALEMNEGLNADQPNPLDLSAAGHTGMNWMAMGPWASNSIAPVIADDLRAFGFNPSDADRQYAADGNQYIFGDIAIRYAIFNETFAGKVPPDEATLKRFFTDMDHPLLPGRRLFEDGQRQLRDGFVHYLAAANASDPFTRQRHAMFGNLLIATHEQAGAQHALEGITDLDAEDGFRVFGEVLDAIPKTNFMDDERMATNQMELQVGMGDDVVTHRMSENIEYVADPDNLVQRSDIQTVLNPEPIDVVSVGDITVSLDGQPADVSLEALRGWSNPPPGSNMDPFPTDAREWIEHGASDGGYAPGGASALAGSRAADWSDPNNRQAYIALLFQQSHTNNEVVAELSELGPGSPWGQRFDYLPKSIRSAHRN